MSFVRNIFTGELEERPASEPGIIARTTVSPFAVQKRSGSSPWYKENLSKAMTIPPEQATPERIARENEAARKHGTGAQYSPDGKCYLPTRTGRAREMQRRGFQDNEAGFKDYGGR